MSDEGLSSDVDSDDSSDDDPLPKTFRFVSFMFYVLGNFRRHPIFSNNIFTCLNEL
jgi:hypothetical protein